VVTLQLVICSKSAWAPTIRREHAIARSAAARGREVTFVERALDLRALGDHCGARAWVRGLRGLGGQVEPRVHVVSQATLVPGHRSPVALWTDAARLKRTLRRLPGIGRSVVVVTQPWDWPAVAATPAARRVFDAADDWRKLIGSRSEPLDRLYRRIGADADAVIVASPELVSLFARSEPIVVPNGTDSDLLATPPTPPGAERRMVYAGTLSERFDATLLLEVLVHLPEWSVELYGQCRYAGHRDRPAPELVSLLDRARGRVWWHGPVERDGLAAALDRATVLIAPHRAQQARGQDSMKLYDYAARGRPIVSTPGALGSGDHVAAAGVVEAHDAEEFARMVCWASQRDPSRAPSREWAVANAWESRWSAWERAAFGEATGEEVPR